VQNCYGNKQKETWYTNYDGPFTHFDARVTAMKRRLCLP
jgi:hypothetical protein